MITMKDIIREGHETLYKVAEEVPIPMPEEDKELLFKMMEYVKNSVNEEIAKKYGLRPAVGLAAPQVNVSKRMTAIHTWDEKNRSLHSYMMVNPKIVSHSEELTYLPMGEGCLSIDREVEGLVMRYRRVTIDTYLLKEDGTLERVRLRLKGYPAVVAQHEIDHLNGILFPQRIHPDNPYFIPEGAVPIEFNLD
ncbi:MAG TPA: peptide deformylase [Haloplasmataceae bacterium]